LNVNDFNCTVEGSNMSEMVQYKDDIRPVKEQQFTAEVL